MRLVKAAGIVFSGALVLLIVLQTFRRQEKEAFALNAAHVNADCGFSMRLPQGWTINAPEATEDSRCKAGLVLVATENAAKDSPEFNANITLAERSAAEMKGQRPWTLVKDAVAMLHGLPLEPTGDAEVFEQDGWVGVRRRFNYLQQTESGSRPLTSIVSAFLSSERGTCFLLTATASQPVFERYAPLFQAVAASFEPVPAEAKNTGQTRATRDGAGDGKG